MDRMEPLGVDPSVLIDRLREEKDASVKRAQLLVLADYRGKGSPSAETELLKSELLEMFRTDPDPGIHSSAELVLRKFGHGEVVDALTRRLKSANRRQVGDRWYVNSEEHTMVVIDPRGKDPALSGGRPVDRVFEMATKEVTVEQFLRFRSKIEYNSVTSPTTNCPINCVTWYQAIAYCRWLSEQEEVRRRPDVLPPQE